jgi:tetratricopeptide (TPR) repeat protein
VSSPRPRDTAAFTRFLEGRYLSRQFDAPNLQRTVDAFTLATRDSAYPLARVELAEAYARAARWGARVPPQSLALSGVSASRQAYADRSQSAEGRMRAVAAGEALRAFLPRSEAPPTLPNTVEGWRTRALRALRTGNVSEAESALRRAIARDPSDAESLTELGDLLVLQSRDAEACRVLERAVTADPRIAPAYAMRAVALVRSGRRGGNAGAVRAAFADAEVTTQLGRPLWGEAAWSVVQLASRDTAGAKATARNLVNRLQGERVGYWDARLAGEALVGVRDTAGLRILRTRLPAEDPRRGLLVRMLGGTTNGPRR